MILTRGGYELEPGTPLFQIHRSVHRVHVDLLALLSGGRHVCGLGRGRARPHRRQPVPALRVPGVHPGHPAGHRHLHRPVHRPGAEGRGAARNYFNQNLFVVIAATLLLAVLVLVLDYPILTAGQALRATQKRYFFGPGEVLTSIDFSRGYNKFKIGQSDRYYILRWGDWYAWCSVNHYGLFWQSGALDAVENDPSLPLVPLVVSDWQKARCWWCATTRTSPGWKSSSPVFTYSGSDLLATRCPGRR